MECEPGTGLWDTEQVPLLEGGGIEDFLERELLPYTPDAWYVPGRVKTGCEINFTRFFYQPQDLRPREEIRAAILEVSHVWNRRDRGGGVWFGHLGC